MGILIAGVSFLAGILFVVACVDIFKVNISNRRGE